MSIELSFAELLVDLRAGDEAAARQIFERYAQRLIALARGRLGRRFQQKADPEDVLQSVFRSFFHHQAKGEFDLSSWDSLWSLLAVITLRKCGRVIQRFQAKARDIGREAARQASPDTDGSSASFEAIAREPTPSEVLALSETVEEMMRGLEDYQRRIVERSLQGYTAAEISEQETCTVRTVQRVLKRVRERLEKLRGDDP